jgi:hypothetical protein
LCLFCDFAQLDLFLEKNKCSTPCFDRIDDDNGELVPMADHQPFSDSGTATYRGHHFIFTPEDDPENSLIDFYVDSHPENLYWYDPYFVVNDPPTTEKNLAHLTSKQRMQYDQWRKTLNFHEQYKQFTGRSYIANYLRNRPMHFMWRADYFGQQHWVASRETHFTSLPSRDSPELKTITAKGKRRVLKVNEPRLLSQYRNSTQNGLLNMTLTVLSCAPRVFEIQNFLSETEVQHLLHVAGGINLTASTTSASSESSTFEDSRRTRTSYNSWINRERTPVFDAIYRRAADLMRIDEALLRDRDRDEFANVPSRQSLAELLQLVHYDPGQEYAAVGSKFLCIALKKDQMNIFSG